MVGSLIHTGSIGCGQHRWPSLRNDYTEGREDKSVCAEIRSFSPSCVKVSDIFTWWHHERWLGRTRLRSTPGFVGVATDPRKHEVAQPLGKLVVSRPCTLRVHGLPRELPTFDFSTVVCDEEGGVDWWWWIKAQNRALQPLAVAERGHHQEVGPGRRPEFHAPITWPGFLQKIQGANVPPISNTQLCLPDLDTCRIKSALGLMSCQACGGVYFLQMQCTIDCSKRNVYFCPHFLLTYDNPHPTPPPKKKQCCCLPYFKLSV